MIALPEDVALRLLRGMGAYLRATPANDLPTSVRRFKAFRDSALLPHREKVLGLLDDETERALVAQWMTEDEPSLRKEDLQVLRLAVEQPDGWEEELRGLSKETEHAAGGGQSDAKLESSLERQRDKARKAKDELRRVKGELEDSLRAEKTRTSALTQRVAELEGEIESFRTQLGKAEETAAAEQERVDREVRRARSEVDKAEARAGEAVERAKALQKELDAALARIGQLEAKPAKKKAAPTRTPTGPRKPLPVPKGRLDDDPETLRVWLGAADVILLIDGYNVTKAEGGFGEVSLDQQRDRLVKEANKLATRYGMETTIVFDGSEVPPGTTRTLRGPVRVVYSRADEIADDFIIELLAELPQVPVILATNDRELQDRARSHSATIATSNQLLALLR